MIPDTLNIDSLHFYMRECEQTPGMNVLEHGDNVAEKYEEIIDYWNNNIPFPEKWRIPDYISELIPHLLDKDIIRYYQIYHDCGKPFVLEIDEDGKRHFKNHAEVSAKVWLIVDGNEEIANLISMDMDIHLLKADGIAEFATRKEWATLILTGIAEVHANAEMFGGFDSDSFKIKIKQIIKRGKQVINYRKTLK